MNKTFEYDIALSFAGEDREKVEPIALLLKDQGLKIFYDNFETSNLWGKDLYQYLQTIYRDKAQYCIIFCSQKYTEKVWTAHELRQAQERAFMQNSEYILPIRLDNSEVPGINTTTGYIDYNKYTIDELVHLIIEKCNKSITIITKPILDNTIFTIQTTDKNLISIPFNNIIYICNSKNGKIVTLATTYGLFYRTYNFKNLESKLDFYPFIHCNKSLIINITHVNFLNSKEKFLIMKNGYSFNISPKYLSDLLIFYNQFKP